MALEVAGELAAGSSEYVCMPQLLLVGEMLVTLELTVGEILVTLELTGAESEVPFCTIRNWNERGVPLDVPKYVTSSI